MTKSDCFVPLASSVVSVSLPSCIFYFIIFLLAFFFYLPIFVVSFFLTFSLLSSSFFSPSVSSRSFLVF